MSGFVLLFNINTVFLYCCAKSPDIVSSGTSERSQRDGLIQAGLIDQAIEGGGNCRWIQRVFGTLVLELERGTHDDGELTTARTAGRIMVKDQLFVHFS